MGDVCDLVGENSCEFIFAAAGCDEPGVYADVAAWQGKSINAGIVDYEEGEFLPAIIRIGGNTVTDVIDVFSDLRIINQ